MNRRLIILKTVLWALVGGLAALTVARFTQGLGATTNLSDAAPWGLWIALDVMAGVALAAGGFVLAGTVYILGLEKYRPLVRPAILTAFLGYIAVAVGLLYDLGLPWHIWHPMIYWQHHSVLFEVAMCVMTYLAVLALEFSPIVLEHPRLAHPFFRGLLGFLKRVTIPLVICGIILSTLHQSSLGSLFLITPHRLHELWYSPMIYVLFFVSAVGLGMMMVTLESLLSAFFFKHEIRKDLLSGLGLAAAVVLTLYAVLRIGDLAVRGVLAGAFDGSGFSVLFVAEMLVSAIMPAALLWIPRVRRSTAGLAFCSSAAVLGMVWYRLDVAIVAIARPEGLRYFPSWMEFFVSFGVIAAAALVFLFLVETLRVYGERAVTTPKRPSFDPGATVSLAPHALAAPRRYSLVFVAAAALVVHFLPERAVTGVEPARTPVAGVRAVEGFVHNSTPRLELAVASATVPAGARPARLFMIDGNRNGDVVMFDHAAHFSRMEGADSCAACHHLNMPLDQNSSCSECHTDMYESTDVFSHDSHVSKLNGNEGCVKCHPDNSVAKTRETSTACLDCHADQVAAKTFVEKPEARWRQAVGYMDGMHKLCIECHKARLAENPDRHAANMVRCDGCHDVDYSARLAELIPAQKDTAGGVGSGGSVDRERR